MQRVAQRKKLINMGLVKSSKDEDISLKDFIKYNVLSFSGLK